MASNNGSVDSVSDPKLVGMACAAFLPIELFFAAIATIWTKTALFEEMGISALAISFVLLVGALSALIWAWRSYFASLERFETAGMDDQHELVRRGSWIGLMVLTIGAALFAVMLVD